MGNIIPPRLYCLPATDAPVVAVFRRGPSQWSHIGCWDLLTQKYEPGAWLKGRIFPRRSDLSPDGRFLCYFAHQPNATWLYGTTYIAVSRFPWLQALYAFGTCGTWTRGYHFTSSSAPSSITTLPIPYQLAPTPSIQFANERRRGWQEAPDSPPHNPKDIWDQRRNARLQKQQPGGNHRLCVESLGQAGGEFGVDQAVDGLRVLYSLECEDAIAILETVQWADWDNTGRLLVATRTGQLQHWTLATPTPEIQIIADLSHLTPNPQPAPAWAQHW